MLRLIVCGNSLNLLIVTYLHSASPKFQWHVWSLRAWHSFNLSLVELEEVPYKKKLAYARVYYRSFELSQVI